MWYDGGWGHHLGDPLREQDKPPASAPCIAYDCIVFKANIDTFCQHFGGGVCYLQGICSLRYVLYCIHLCCHLWLCAVVGVGGLARQGSSKEGARGVGGEVAGLGGVAHAIASIVEHLGEGQVQREALEQRNPPP